MASSLIDIERLRKANAGLRPVRIERLRLDARERVALLGLDAAGAETLVNLVTGALLPDDGVVRVFGRETGAVTDPDDWLQMLEPFALISMRAVLLADLTVAQNVALSFTLSVDPVPDAVAADVRRLGVEAGIPQSDLERPLGAVAAETVARCHLARALAGDPTLLLLEHANGLTTSADAAAFGRDIARVADRRRAAVLALTADESFAYAVGRTVSRVDGATGRLESLAAWRRWFR